MTQLAYGTITITDTNDIESIIIEYAQNQNPSSAPESGWSTNRPAWAQGYYIWQRTRTHKTGTETSEDTYGTAVCITGSTGSTGSTGAAGRSLSSTVTHYTIATSSATINQSNMGSYTWTTNVPSYNASYPTYWVRVTNTYSNPSSTEYIFYKDQGITDAVKTSHDANTIAGQAKTAADKAKEIAQQTSTDVTNLQTRTKYFWTNLTAHTNGTSGWTKPDYPVGTFAASGISGTTFDYENSSTYGYNTLYSNGIKLRYNAINLGELTGTALTFYHPSTVSQGAKAMELSATALKFYDATGSIAQAEFGGTQAKISGTINAYDGKIGNNNSNYWYIGNYTDYNQNDSAIIKSIGTASIQLNETNTWRVATNRIHTAWAPSTGTDAFKLHFPIFNDSNSNSKHWDYGLHLPTSKDDKFLYIRNAASTQTLDNLLDDLEDSGYNYWTYKFYIDGDGNVHAKNFYVGDSNTPVGGGTGSIAEFIINSDSSYGKGSLTQPIYIDSNGRVATTTYQLNAAGAKGVVTDLVNNTTSTNLPTAAAVANYVTSRGYITSFTDKNVQTTKANTTKIYLTGTQTNGTNTGTLNFDEYVYVGTTAGALYATTFNGYTLAAAAAKGVDTSMTSTSTSTNLPTTKAVADLIATYLPLAGGTVSGAVDINDELYADSATFGNLIINGGASFTNNLQANTINGVAVGNSPKFTDTVTTVTVTGNGNAITSMTASNGAITATKGTTFLTSYTETDPVFTASAAHGITSNDISNWNSKTSNTGTVTKVIAGTGLSIGTTAQGNFTTSGTINHTNSVTAKTAAAQSAKTLTWGGTFTLYEEKYDAQGHITGVASYNMTMPANPNTHNTAYLYAGKSDGTENAATTNGNTYLILMDGGAATTRRKISGSGTVGVASDANGNITITGSAHPTSLKNPNALAIKIYNGTSTSSDINYDGSVANQSISVAGTNAITGINSTSDGKLQLTLADGSQPTPIAIKITATTSDSAASADKLNLSANIGSSTQPVYFDANTGLPVAIDYTIQSNVPQNAKFTDTWTAMVGATSSTNGSVGYVNAVPPKDGYNTKFLRADGTWVVPGGTYSLPLAANGTRGGVQIGYTQSGKNYPVQLSSEKMYVNVPWENTTYSAGNGLRLNGTQFINTRIPFVVGTQTAATGSWTGVCNDITALYDGLTIAYWLPYAGSGNATLNLTINGTTTGAKNCYYGGTSRLTTHFGAGNIIYLTYQSAANINGTTYEGWWANANYNSDYTIGYSWTAAATAAKSFTASYFYVNSTKCWFPLCLIYGNTYAGAITFNVNSSGAKPVYINGVASSANNYALEKGYYLVYWDGTNFYIRTDGKITGDITGNSATTTAFSSNAAVTLTGDTTGTASSTKGWSVTTKTDRLSTVGDNRTVATTPNDYTNKIIFQGLKRNSSFGSPSTNTYSYVVGLRGWSDSSGGDAHELAFNNSGIFRRQGATTSWGNWFKLLDSNNYTSYTVTKTGTGASGSWGISITGNAATATKANITTTTNAVAKYSDTNGTFADSTTTFDGNNLVIGSTDNPGNIKIGAKNDNYGLMPNTSNYNQIGSSSLYWYRSYITHYYGTQSHINNWDAGKNIGTAVTSGAASTLGSVNFYNTCAAGGTQTKTLLTADSTANSNVTITLPKTTGTLALTSEIPTNYVTLNTVQNITANKIFSAGIKWTAESGTNPSKFGACSYNSTLEALVFSFS